MAADHGASSTESAPFFANPVASDPTTAFRVVMTLACASSSAVSVPYVLVGPLVPPPPSTRYTVPSAVFHAGVPPWLYGSVVTTDGRRVSTLAPLVWPGLGATTVPSSPAS